MKAIVHSGQSGLAGLQYTTSNARTPEYGEVQIQLKSAGINHRDLFVMAERTTQDTALIPGSDGAGIIVEIGEGVRGFTVGDEVIIHPTLGWENASDVPDRTRYCRWPYAWNARTMYNIAC